MGKKRKVAVEASAASPSKVWCTRCHSPRSPEDAHCPICKNPEFSLTPLCVVSEKEKWDWQIRPTVDLAFCGECGSILVKTRTGWCCPEFHGKIIMPRHPVGQAIQKVARVVNRQRKLAHLPQAEKSFRALWQIWTLDGKGHYRRVTKAKDGYLHSDQQGWVKGRVQWFRKVLPHQLGTERTGK
jgi:hypothetical protein